MHMRFRSVAPLPSEPAFLTLHRHFDDTVLDMWRGPGFNATLALAHEALSTSDGVLLPCSPKRFRAMACARQLYVFAKTGDMAHARRLFDSLRTVFRDPEHGGFYYSVAPDGSPLETDKDLYTHAFVLFAVSAYFGYTGDTDARALLHDVADVIETRFPLDAVHALPHAALDASFTTPRAGPLQNPLMHLTEAYLMALDATDDTRFDTALDRLLPRIAACFVDPISQCVMELPHIEAASWIEPGHQFEWFYLAVDSRHRAFAASGLAGTLVQAFTFAHAHGVDAVTHAVAASVDRQGKLIDGTQRIWAQTEYLRALAVHPDGAIRATAPEQAVYFAQRFLLPLGWHEALDVHGNVVRGDMPSTTPYHLATAYDALR
jgi:mannose-6-phosphate isomerase